MNLRYGIGTRCVIGTLSKRRYSEGSPRTIAMLNHAGARTGSSATGCGALFFRPSPPIDDVSSRHTLSPKEGPNQELSRTSTIRKLHSDVHEREPESDSLSRGRFSLPQIMTFCFHRNKKVMFGERLMCGLATPQSTFSRETMGHDNKFLARTPVRII